MASTDIDSFLRRGSSRRRWLYLSVAVAVIVVAAVVAYLLTRPDESDVVFEAERAEAVLGQLSSDVEISGSAESERNATLSFEVDGVVVSVAGGGRAGGSHGGRAGHSG